MRLTTEREPLTPMRTLLDARERRRLTGLVLALPVLGAVDALGLAVIIAVFLHIVGIHALPLFHRLWLWVNARTVPQLSERGFGQLLLVLIAAIRFATGMLTQYLIYHFCYAVQRRVSADLLRNFLATDLDYIATKDKAFGVQIVFNECARYCVGILVNGLQIAYETLTLVIYMVVVIYTNVKLSLLLAASVAVVFAIVRRVSERATQRLGRSRLDLDAARLSLINEAFQGFQEIGAYDLAAGFVASYTRATDQSLGATLRQQLLNLLPKNVFELLLVFGLLVIAFATTGPLSQNLVATMAILLGAAFRCMPSINRILSSRQLMSFEMPVARELAALWREAVQARRAGPPTGRAAGVPASARATIHVPGVRFERDGHGRRFEFEIGPLELGPDELVLITGETGSGKSTYLACIAGLLTRGCTIGAGGAAPSRMPRISYAPQTPFVLNETLAGNVTLAQFLPDHPIDPARLLEALRVAQLIDATGRPIIPFDQLLKGSGAGLSGGQRQRIALARALYFDSELLVLDEVTSALDESTEKAFLAAYRTSALRRATIFVTHRGQLASFATRVYRMEGGTLVAPEICNAAG